MQVNKFEVIGEAYKVKTFGTTQSDPPCEVQRI